MSLVTEPDTYSPSVDENGNYVDKISSFSLYKNGLRCLCGARKDKVYESQPVFTQHVKTKIHQKWLNDLNLNKINYFVENEDLKKTIRNQQIIIANKDKESQELLITIRHLTKQITEHEKTNKKQQTINDLLDLN